VLHNHNWLLTVHFISKHINVFSVGGHKDIYFHLMVSLLVWHFLSEVYDKKIHTWPFSYHPPTHISPWLCLVLIWGSRDDMEKVMYYLFYLSWIMTREFPVNRFHSKSFYVLRHSVWMIRISVLVKVNGIRHYSFIDLIVPCFSHK
jgi:hypothetical protein